MPYPRVDAAAAGAQPRLVSALAQLREEFGLPGEFAPDVAAEIEQAIADHRLPDTDLTDLPFVTIDPAGAADLDQALYITHRGIGTRVYYAIADVPSFVRAGGAVDAEARRRGQTIYAPDGRIPLHPVPMSEAAASLLPNRKRSAYVWELDLAVDASVLSARVRRARIISTARLTYEQAQASLDDGSAGESLRLLRDVGRARVELERARGGASLSVPSREIVYRSGRYRIDSTGALPVEDWNAQISLMTGMAAARIMLDGGVGILRTLPPPDDDAVAVFRRQTEALGSPWNPSVPYGEYLRGLDTTEPAQLALMHAAASLFRGAGYTAFDGAVPADASQAAVAAPYAHTTAPLRRLVDRFVLVICEALCSGAEVPGWAREALDELPSIMNASDQLAARLEHAAMDAVEATVLSRRVGEVFDAVVITGSSHNHHGAGDTAQGGAPPDGTTPDRTTPDGTAPGGKTPGGTIQLTEPVVTAKCDGDLRAGSRIRARLVTADIEKGRLRFVSVPDAP